MYTGSMAKGTMVRESYDLDIVCRFPVDESESLKDLYERTYQSLAKTHTVQKKVSAVRVLSLESNDEKPRDFHIDVVPVRLFDEKTGDAFIYQSSNDQERLKTNIQVHVNYVKDSGLRDTIRLAKLWKVRHQFAIRTFVLEILAVRFLEKPSGDLESNMIRFLSVCRDSLPTARLLDPANSNNVISDLMTDADKELVSNHASQDLENLDGESEDEARVRAWMSILRESPRQVEDTIAPPEVLVRQPPKPWSKD
jgi:hypothetical protein